MTNRILDFSQAPVSLSIRNGLLVIRNGGVDVESVACGDIAAVVISHREVVFTQAVLGELAKTGASVIVCDSTRRPVAMMLPLQSHHIQAERFRRQAEMPRPRRKRLWQQIVRAKIAAQGDVLRDYRSTDAGLHALISHVRSGDPDNVEARAARRYWAVLFGDGPFTRSDAVDERNHWLDYGYAVLRAATARAICGSGLHPTFGLAHRSKANAFALADDLMEPFRPVIDRVVVSSPTGPLHTEAKRRLIGAVAGRYVVDGENWTLFDILTRVAQSLARVIMGEADVLWLPTWRSEVSDAVERKPLGAASSVGSDRRALG